MLHPRAPRPPRPPWSRWSCRSCRSCRSNHGQASPGRTHRRAFTLAELLVVMAVVALIATITVVAVGKISKQSRVSSGVNAVVTALNNARAIAIRDSETVLAVFHVQWAGDDQRQRVEVVLTRWSGVTDLQGGNPGFFIKDIFVPIQDIRRWALPPGIKVAGAWYDLPGNDDIWVTQPELRETGSDASSEFPGRMFGIMFAADGSIVTTNPTSNADDAYVDWNGDGQQQIGGTSGGSRFWAYDEPADEPNVEPVPFLAVFDDDLVREIFDPREWRGGAGETNFQRDVSGPRGYITENVDPLYFNRFTGVVMK